MTNTSVGLKTDTADVVLVLLTEFCVWRAFKWAVIKNRLLSLEVVLCPSHFAQHLLPCLGFAVLLLFIWTLASWFGTREEVAMINMRPRFLPRAGITWDEDILLRLFGWGAACHSFPIGSSEEVLKS